MLINKIQKLKNNKYKVIIDGEIIITFDNVILENNLLYKKVIDNDIYNKILLDTEYYDNYNKTVKYILKKRRSEKEVREYLNKLNVNNIDIEKIINKLKNINLINDEEFCKAFINDKINLSKCGINKIKIELLKQDIPIENIETEFKKIDKEKLNNKLEKLIIKKINTNKKYSNIQLKQRILNEMVSLGYNKESIINIIEKNLIEDNNIMEKEFEKIYNKLCKKYSGEELNLKLKQKMLQKGFYNDQIINLIQEKTED